MISHCDFISLMTNDVEHIFMCFLAHGYIFFGEIVVIYFLVLKEVLVVKLSCFCLLDNCFENISLALLLGATDISPNNSIQYYFLCLALFL